MNHLNEPDCPPKDRKGRIVFERGILTQNISVTPPQKQERGLVANLKIVLDQVENEVPVRTRDVLQDRNEMEKHVRDLALDILIDFLIRREPSLARLHEIHRTRLWQKRYVRIWIWR